MISAFVASYGYLAVFAGALLEGETMLIAAGFAAHRGLLDWPTVIVVAVGGGVLGDQLAFMLGRWKGDALIVRFPALAAQKARVHAVLERHATVFILSVRFLYGLRIAGPVLLGSSRVPFLRFAVLNVIGAVPWAALVSGAGYFFGYTMGSLLSNLKHIEEAVLLGILVTGAVVWLWRRRRARASRAADARHDSAS
ncbi:MAG: DedA family protein [Azoarcus sp.]|nr:MAG: DedA family protein [Azoarcus sp.]